MEEKLRVIERDSLNTQVVLDFQELRGDRELGMRLLCRNNFGNNRL